MAIVKQYSIFTNNIGTSCALTPTVRTADAQISKLMAELLFNIGNVRYY